MSSKRILTISVVISLFGHLIVLSAFSWNRAGEMKKKIAPTQVSFWGELPEEGRREVKLVPKERGPKLEPAIKEPEAGPRLLFTKTAAALPNPMTGVEEIASSLIKEEHLLEGGKLSPGKEVPNRRPHLLEIPESIDQPQRTQRENTKDKEHE